jgi:phosphoribosyl 1,2-cyclic phosphodiesterase
MKVKIWGCRGSLPSPVPPHLVEERIRKILRDFSLTARDSACADKFLSEYKPWQIGGYGGHTACIEVSTPTTQLIIDGGSGIRRVGNNLLKGPCGLGKGEAHILFTHFHWDHIVGLPFFTPLFIPGNNIHCHAVQPDLQEMFEHVFKKPYFPVPLKDLGANIHYHSITPREAKMFGDIKVTPYQLDHPDPCWGYKFEHDGKVFSYAVDSEVSRMSREEMGADLPLYQNVDLLLFDAQYTFKEVTERINWGHGTAPVGLDIAMRENVKSIYFMHHDPAASDEKIASAEEQTMEYYEYKLKSGKETGRHFKPLEWGFAREEMEFDLGKKSA